MRADHLAGLHAGGVSVRLGGTVSQHLRLGGEMLAWIDDQGGQTASLSSFLLIAGWELRVGRRVYLNPAVDLVGHRYTGRAGDRYHERLLNFGLGILFQSGR